MKSVRKSLFETNSSAMHSLTIQDVKDKSHNHFDFNVQNNVLKIHLESYTHDPRLLTTPNEKLNYYLSYLLTNLQNYIDCSKSEYKDYDGYVNFAKIKLEKANEFIQNSENTFDYQVENNIDISIFLSQLNFIKEILTDEYHCKIELEGDPHVSHRANGLIEKYLGIINKENIKDMLLNPDVIIVIDSDKHKYFNQFNNKSGYFFGDELETNNKIDRDVTFHRLSNVLHNSIISQLKLDYVQSSIKLKGIIVDGKTYNVDGLICYPQNNILVFKKLGKFELLDFSYDKYQKIKSIVIKSDDVVELHLRHHDVRVQADREHMEYFVEFFRYDI